ncbi:Furin [Geodia barretti]|uniref:Furin n=1 Tax=Geodia barretti TaxID=519541 RepID=A0AA35S003_GEOBA|nr:Furin [Geodia barretti]
MATKQHCVFVCAAFFTLATHIATANYTADWAVEINEGGEGMAHTIARLYGFRNLGKIGGLENVYHFEKISPLNDTQRAESDLGRHLCSEPSVVLAEQQFQEEREVKSLPSSSGIHQPEGSHNFSVSIERAWNQSLSGCNVSVAVVDDLIEVNHTDLRSNFAPNISYDAFHRMGLVYEREQRYTKQGTTCSRIIASSSPMANESCVLGIAYKSNFGALRIFGYDKENTKRYATDITEAIALSYKREIIDIYSNCWGAPDTGADVSGPKTITRRILADGVTEGRDGKGSIFVWANGNGGPNDDCAADGYASSPYTISVGAIRGDGRPSEYDEPCSAKLTVAPVTNGIMRNTATDETECDIVLNGTSAAASMVSGIIALALEANPSLTWRDVQYLIVYTANPNLTNDTDNLTWNGAGRAVSRQYGFGVMDAEAMVTRARHWINVPPQLIDPACMPPNQSGKASKSAPFSTTLNYTGKISYLEHVVVVISISADPRGDIQIYLESPAGTNVTLLQNRPNDTEAGKYNKWPFMSVMFWGENPNGNWTLTISNRNSAVEANITVEKFEFHGVLYTPMVITRIPKHDCERACAAEGFEYCDSCKNFRNAHTRECIDTCPPGYYKLDYCYNDESEPIEECESPLKYKIEDECNINNGGCEQDCTYAYTSRKCSCENGYMLDANRKNCSGYST